MFLRKLKISRASVARACNPCYSGGRDQEYRGLKPAILFYLKKTTQKRAGGVAQSVGLEFKLWYWKKTKRSHVKESSSSAWNYFPGLGSNHVPHDSAS
jgi:hypothetical protein